MATVTQRVPDLRWTNTGRDFTVESFPVTLTVSRPIAVEGFSRMVGTRTAGARDAGATAASPCGANAAVVAGADSGTVSLAAACADETAPSGDTIATTAIDTTNNRRRAGRPA
ncbi:MAG TPA: hypothetical protein VN712_00840 [Dermatophilaceae bacterium]|nr:hypothetical protein [Dermatophilaceae bacterium]